MKLLSNVLILFFFPVIVFAQVVDDSAINKIQKGNYSIEKGKIQVTFADTVSPDFIEKEMGLMGLKLLSSNFQPIMLRVTEIPEALTMKDLEDNKWVEFIMSESAGLDEKEFQEINKEDTVDSKRINDMLAQLNHSGKYEYIMLGLTYAATDEAISEILSIHPDLNIEIEERGERTAVIETKPDQELAVMDELNKLSYVKNTAMIGYLEQ
jgi:ribonucleotide reductase alpha subunit